jgi:hypothetical protein
MARSDNELQYKYGPYDYRTDAEDTRLIIEERARENERAYQARERENERQQRERELELERQRKQKQDAEKRRKTLDREEARRKEKEAARQSKEAKKQKRQGKAVPAVSSPNDSPKSQNNSNGIKKFWVFICTGSALFLVYYQQWYSLVPSGKEWMTFVGAGLIGAMFGASFHDLLNKLLVLGIVLSLAAVAIMLYMGW